MANGIGVLLKVSVGVLVDVLAGNFVSVDICTAGLILVDVAVFVGEVGVRVGVDVAVFVGKVGVRVGVNVAVFVEVAGMRVGIDVAVFVRVAAMRVDVTVFVRVAGIRVGVDVAVFVGVAGTRVGVDVAVFVEVAGARVGVDVAVFVGVAGTLIKVEVDVDVTVFVRVAGIRVGVDVAVFVGGGLIPISTAPISQIKLPAPSTGRVTPRWSVTSQAPPPLPGADGLPASIAGLPTSNVYVEVGPPLFVSAPSRALIGALLLPNRSPVPPLKLQPLTPIKLWPPEMILPSQSGRLLLPVVIFPAIMLFATLTLPPFAIKPVAC